MFSQESVGSGDSIFESAAVKPTSRPAAQRNQLLGALILFSVRVLYFELGFRSHLLNLVAGCHQSTLCHGTIRLRKEVLPNVIYYSDRKHSP